MLDRRVDGLIVVPDDEHRLEPYRHLEVPLVTVNRQTMPADDDPPSVEIDNLRAGYLATSHLIRLGHTRIGLISNLLNCGRYNGYHRALEEAGIAFDERRVIVASELAADLVAQGRASMRKLLLNTSFTACFVVDDVRAVGALEALHDAHIAVPHDIALVGCGDLQVASLTRPRLTTINHPKVRLGVQAVRLLLDLFTDSTTNRRVVMPVELVIRESCGAVTKSV
jgi:LacI family transcriptional regulator